MEFLKFSSRNSFFAYKFKMKNNCYVFDVRWIKHGRDRRVSGASRNGKKSNLPPNVSAFLSCEIEFCTVLYFRYSTPQAVLTLNNLAIEKFNLKHAHYCDDKFSPERGLIGQLAKLPVSADLRMEKLYKNFISFLFKRFKDLNFLFKKIHLILAMATFLIYFAVPRGNLKKTDFVQTHLNAERQCSGRASIFSDGRILPKK